jgi:hypothetical protein
MVDVPNKSQRENAILNNLNEKTLRCEKSMISVLNELTSKYNSGEGLSESIYGHPCLTDICSSFLKQIACGRIKSHFGEYVNDCRYISDGDGPDIIAVNFK